MTTHADLVVVGAGSGGFGAAYAAARLGARVVLIEASNGVGGTSSWAGVNNWEPVAGGTSFPAQLYQALISTGDACLQRRGCVYHPDRPWGVVRPRSKQHRLPPQSQSSQRDAYHLRTGALDRVMRQLLTSAGCDVRLETRFVEVDVDRVGRRVRAIITQDATGQRQRLEADQFIDATADIYLARQAGCQSRVGPESHAEYDEPSASDAEGVVLNNASPCYRVSPLRESEAPEIEPLPERADVGLDDLRPVTSIRTYPNGDLNMNPLHLMTGVEALRLDSEARDIAFLRARAHWHLLQTRHGFYRWRLVWMSPALGTRETHRLMGRYVLREQDLDAGLAAQSHDDIITFADHAIDLHGRGRHGRYPTAPTGYLSAVCCRRNWTTCSSLVAGQVSVRSVRRVVV